MTVLDAKLARRIIDNLGSAGQPPEYGVQHFTVGLDPYLDVIRDDYLATYIQDGGAAFKLVVGIYGGGKTHFLYSVRDMAWEQNFVVSYVSLKSSGECPFHRLELVYKAIAGGLLAPLGEEERNPDDLKGMTNFLRTWYVSRVSEYRSRGMDNASAAKAVDDEIGQLDTTTSISFRNAIVKALRALAAGQDRQFDEMCQWLLGEDGIRSSLMQHGVNEKIDKTTAFKMIRSLGQIIRQMGYSGLVVLLDEAERVPSLSTKQREQHLSNLRELIDECGLSTFQGLMLFYAVPDENFLDGRTQVYEALRQRLSTQFDDLNPYGVRIGLEKLVVDPEDFLTQVGNKIVPIFNLAHNKTLDPQLAGDLVTKVADLAYSQRFADDGYKRLFVQKLVQGLRYLRAKGTVPSAEELS
jgi:hypothetical protein